MGEIAGTLDGPGRSVGQMYFPRFLVGMTATLLVVLGWTYASTGSIWASLGWTLLAGVLLQAAYFIVVLVLIQREGSAVSESKAGDTAPAKLPGPFERDGIIQALISRLKLL